MYCLVYRKVSVSVMWVVERGVFVSLRRVGWSVGRRCAGFRLQRSFIGRHVLDQQRQLSSNEHYGCSMAFSSPTIRCSHFWIIFGSKYKSTAGIRSIGIKTGDNIVQVSTLSACKRFCVYGPDLRIETLVYLLAYFSPLLVSYIGSCWLRITIAALVSRRNAEVIRYMRQRAGTESPGWGGFEFI